MSVTASPGASTTEETRLPDGALMAQRDAFQSAREAAASLETSIAIARHAELLPLATCADLSARAASTSRIIAGYQLYLERQVSAEMADVSESRTVS